MTVDVQTATVDNLVEVDSLRVWFPVQHGIFETLVSGHKDYVHAVDDVSFDIRRGEVFGLAGESGSGKSTTGRAIIRLLDPTAGKISFDGIDMQTLSAEELRHLRRRMQVIFQDPMASLNPRMSLGASIAHPLQIHFPKQKARHHEMASEMMEHVGLSPSRFYYDKYPHQISGGQRQRVVIARALITHPDLVIADEPIAMADVSVRALLLDLMIKLKQELNLTYLFITHDLATAKYICDRLGVMYLGKMCEMGNLKDVYGEPLHPYTRALLAAVPVPDPHRRRTEAMPEGEIPNAIHPPEGCRYHPRCPLAQSICSQQDPELRELRPGHFVACHLAR